MGQMTIALEWITVSGGRRVVLSRPGKALLRTLLRLAWIVAR